MPVTVTLNNNTPKPWQGTRVTTPEELFHDSCSRESAQFVGIAETSLTRDVLNQAHISGSENGFVWAVCEAYSEHHNLTIRPEDVWFAILAQLGFHINARPEAPRDPFVESRDEENNSVKLTANPLFFDIPVVKHILGRMAEKKMDDPKFLEWSIPSFTTTTETDRIVASVLTVGSAQLSSTFGPGLLCGIPSVTLLGEVEDWEEMVNRLGKLSDIGKEAGNFGWILHPILKNFVNTFMDPDHEEVKDFWSRIVTEVPLAEGRNGLKGWITAFCFWNEHGLANFTHDDVIRDRIEGVVIETGKIPAGYAQVPIDVHEDGQDFTFTILAGSVGIKSLDHADADVSEQTGIQPVSGWFIYENKGPQTPCALVGLGNVEED